MVAEHPRQLGLDNQRMHLLLSFASAWPDSPMPATPHLQRLLQQWSEVARDEGQETEPALPQDRLLARALGWRETQPWAAQQARRDGVALGSHAWGLLTPVHWQVGTDAVHLADPNELGLSDTESRALLDVLRPWFEDEGFTVAWGAALRWYVAHDSLATLRTASLDRVIGRNVDRWLPAQAEARLIRRLQNEAQMLLHEHPLNLARAERGALTVNSFWLSGCGVAQKEATHDLVLDDRLRAPTLAQDPASLSAAWQAVDRRIGQGGFAQLTLCGERSAVTFAPTHQSLMQRLWRRFTQATPNLKDLLECI
jgi:hypothetical protein